MRFMMPRSLILSLGLGLLAACAPARAAAPSGPGFAVVELFTSEGCSSCPPADAVLADITRENALRPVYTLSFHVDYWNDLGWRDPYSATWASQRQRAYAAALGGHGVYTPQLVIDGRDALIGSHASEARASIERALATPRRARLQIDAKRAPDYADVHYRLAAAPQADSVLRVALVEPEAQGTVRAGENSGRVLRHVHVVHSFVSLPLTAADGHVAIAWPRELTAEQREQLFVVAFVQARATLQIDAAARATFESKG